ncbi:unnamed protein product, partial [Closterium sp. Naga37s-1]
MAPKRKRGVRRSRQQEQVRDDSPEVQEVVWVGGKFVPVVDVQHVTEVPELVVALEVGRAQRLVEDDDEPREYGAGGRRRAARERREDRRAETNGSDGSGTPRIKWLGKGCASGGGVSASKRPADVVKQERAAGSDAREADVAARLKAGLPVVKQERAAGSGAREADVATRLQAGLPVVKRGAANVAEKESIPRTRPPWFTVLVAAWVL